MVPCVYVVSGFPRPTLTPTLAYHLLPVAHKYDMGGLVEEAVTAAAAASSFNAPDQPGESIVAWSALGERLQLPALADMCACWLNRKNVCTLGTFLKTTESWKVCVSIE